MRAACERCRPGNRCLRPALACPGDAWRTRRNEVRSADCRWRPGLGAAPGMRQRGCQEEQQRPSGLAGRGKNGDGYTGHLQRVGMQMAEGTVFQMQRGWSVRIVAAGMRIGCVGVGAADIFGCAIVGSAVKLRMVRRSRLGKGMGNCRRHRSDDDRENGQPGGHGTLHFPFRHC